MFSVDFLDTRIVFKGEVAVQQGMEGLNLTMKSPSPQTGVLLTLHNKEHRVSVMAHLDCYTSPAHVFSKVSEILQRDCGYKFQDLDFSAKIYYAKESGSLAKTILNALNAYPISSIEHIDLPKAFTKQPQIELNALDGTIQLDNTTKNQRLEYLQTIEYIEFVKFLEDKYTDEEIPYFQSNEAERTENLLPLSKRANQPKDGAEMREKIIPLLRPLSRTPTPESNIYQTLKLVVSHSFPKDKGLRVSLKSKNFYLMLRQSLIDEKYIKITKIILENSDFLGVDLAACAKSGKSLHEIAVEQKNKSAAALLDKYLIA